MRTLFIWENCHVFDGKRAFWIEVTLETFHRDIQSSVPETNICEGDLNVYLKKVERAANTFPNLVKKNHVYLLVREDGMAYEMPEPTLPYSPLWNAYCPLELFQKEIASLSCLPQMDTRDVDGR